jgi:hypothetical protein
VSVGPSADKSRESGVIREIDGGGGARAASEKCMPDQTSDNCGDICSGRNEKTSTIVSLPVVLFRRKVAMILSPGALFSRNTVLSGP